MEQKIPEKLKKFFTKKNTIIVCVAAAAAVLVIVLLRFFVKECNFYQEHYYENTYINGIDCSNMTPAEVKEILQADVDSFQLTVKTVSGDDPVITAQDLNMIYVDDGRLDEILQEQKPSGWIGGHFGDSNYDAATEISYDQDMLNDWVSSLPFMTDYTVSEDAALVQGEDGYWSIKEEVIGNEPDQDAVRTLIREAVENRESEVSVTDESLYYAPEIYADDEDLNAELEEKNYAQRIEELTSAVITFRLPDGESKVLDKDTLKNWIVEGDTIDDIKISRKKIDAWAEEMAAYFPTDSGEKYFVTTDGEVLTLYYGYSYGWTYDAEGTADKLEKAIKSGKTKDLTPALIREDSEGNDTGNIYVEISIDQQNMWVYKDGELMVDTPIVSGNLSISGRATPRNGVWAITAKMSPHHMVGAADENGNPSYECDVDYWMPFNDAIGIHDLASRTAFGGDIYKTNGSHGCINTPYKAVQQIYSIVSVGTPVVVY